MKKLTTLLILLFLGVGYGFAQEDCYNGIDDDADGDIDLNDSECDCAGIGGGTITSLIPNPSFEDMLCCPTSAAELTCADTWQQASAATSDYFNTCGITAKFGMTPPSFPLPGAAGGAGYAGFYEQGSVAWQEYIGACLTSPMIAGTPYVLNLWIAWGDVGNDFDLAIFGTPNCGDLPWFDNDCPVGEGDWELLDVTPLVVPFDGSWIEVTLNFTPTVDMYAVCIGSDCEPLPSSWDYFYVDELVLLDSTSFVSSGAITTTGNWCDDDLTLHTTIDTFGGTWQWFYEGVAIIGETDTFLNVMTPGAGTYQAVYTIGADCVMEQYTVVESGVPSADFSFNDQCNPDPVDFTDESTVTTGTIATWEWDFGDAGTSGDSDPTHPYAGPGAYTTELIVTSADGCKDTIEYVVNVFPSPTADFEFEINGESSADGLTGSCVSDLVEFFDLSTVEPGGVITDWDWDFGDFNTSNLQNPTHTYATAGTYTISLTVTTADGCEHTFSMDITMTDVLDLDIIFNNPTCWGFTDGSVTGNYSGGAGTPTIEITNSAGTVLNIGGTNTVNSLGEGWIYVFVDDGTSCSAYDSVFVDEPDSLTADMEFFHPLCYGETGAAWVEEVYGAQGDLNNITYIWNPDPQSISGIDADSTWGLDAGTYSLIINDDFGCANEFTFEIVQPDELVFAQLGYDPAYCRLFPFQSGNGVVYAAGGGGTPDYTYEWCGPLGPDEECVPSTTWGGLNPGSYTITITDDNGCILTQTLVMDSLNPIAAFDVISSELNAACEGTAVVCADFINQSLYFANPNNPLADTTFWWNLNEPNSTWDLTKDFYFVPDTCYGIGGLYDVCLSVQNKNGCVDTACKTLTIFTPLELTPPNIFTPDGDGFNDEYTFTHLAKGVKTFHVVIVNRWGVKMAELYDIEDSWDGTDRNGSNCRDGVYFFTYDGEAENGDPFAGQGTIQLVSGGAN